MMLPEELDAAVIYYGRVVTEPARLVPLMMPILGISGGQDRGIPLESVREFEAALQTLGKTAEIVVYEDADHAFANPSGTRYEPEAAADAWRRTLEFFAEHL
jgi:carboxymethylenebutenolidase